MKATQYSRILTYLRKHQSATTWELSQAARSLSVHKRVDEMVNGRGFVWPRVTGWHQAHGDQERITREPIKIGGRNVTLYRLVRG